MKKLENVQRIQKSGSAFDSLCVILNENDECQYSLAELEDRVNEEGKNTYKRKHLTEKLLARQFHHN